MTDREKLIEILSVPIYPRIGADPAEVVADYLMDNDVRPVVRCKDCVHAWHTCDGDLRCEHFGTYETDPIVMENDYCAYGTTKEEYDAE